METVAFDIVNPVVESAMVLAAHYAKATGRSSVTSSDLEYALKFCTRNTVGQATGTLFPEVYEDSDSDEELEVVDESEEEHKFVRYTGPDELLNRVNTSYDTWGEWEPTNMIEQILKNSLDTQNNVEL